MTDKELKMFITNLINEKVNENENFIRYTFYELRIKYNLTEKEVDETCLDNKLRDDCQDL